MQFSEKEFSASESLHLITQMIETTKNSISDRSHYFLLWGWAVVIGCLTQYFLKVILNYPQHYYAWFVTPVAIVLHFMFIYRDNRKERVKTFINEATRYLWTAVGLSFLALAFVFSKIGWVNCYPFYILLYALGTYVSGSLIKFKPMVFGALLCFALVIVCVYLPYDFQILITAFAIIVSYIIPGYMLRSQYKQQKVVSYE
jgi:Flp pilus assembly protein TadB